MTTFLSNRDIYTSFVCGVVPQAKDRLWIATAGIKDMYVGAGGRDMVPEVRPGVRCPTGEARRRGEEEMEVVFCCFSERVKWIYEQVLEELK